MMEVDTIQKWIGKTLKQLNFRQHYNLNIMAIKNDAGDINVNPAADDIIEKGDNLVVTGLNEEIRKLVEFIAKNK